MSNFIDATILGQLPLFFLLLITSCNGQVKTNLPKGRTSEQTAIERGQSKLVKTQGSGQYNEQYETISCGLRDKAGNLWFGTSREGVYRYDGKLFTNYTVKDGLCSNAIFSVLEDKDGTIWFGSKESLCHYDGKTFTNFPIPESTGILFPFINSPNSNPATKNELWSIMQDKSGKIWLGTTDGVYWFNPSNEHTKRRTSFTRFLDNVSLANKDRVHLKWTQCMFEDKNGIIWFGSWVLANEGICRYDGKSITQFKPYGEGWVRSILEDKNGNLLFVTRHNGVCRFDGKTFTNFTKNGGIDNTSITSILEDKAGNLWFGTELGSGQLNEDGGLWCYDGKFFTKYTRKDGLCHNGVFCIVEDKGGIIWVGSRNTDLCRFDGKAFTSFSENASKD